MVRVNLIDPVKLADQHLIAEYDEILMLLGYVRRFPEAIQIPSSYTLGKGHMKFFKNKLLYLQKRHELIKIEMRKRGFKTMKTIDLSEFNPNLCNDWLPHQADFKIITERIKEKLQLKPEYYRYYGKFAPTSFLIGLLDSQS